MARKKVKLTYITDESKRKSSYKKRKSGLIKKIDEISTLCGIEACAIIYGQDDSQPEVWPSPLGVGSVLSRFRGMPETEQSKKMVNQETFLRDKILKVQEQSKKQRNENKRKEMTNLMFQCLINRQVIENVNMNDLNDLSWHIDQKLKEVERKINEIKVAENGVEVVSGGEPTYVSQMQMLETNINVMQNQFENMNFNNNVSAGPSFGAVDIPDL